MAKSQPANKVAKCPTIRLPWERHPCGISFDPDLGRTHQSFKDECSIDNIIDLHTRTGILQHINAGTPQYVDNPESTLYEAACVAAEVRSVIEDGWEPPEAPDDDTETDDTPTGESPSEAPSEPLEPQAETPEG